MHLHRELKPNRAQNLHSFIQLDRLLTRLNSPNRPFGNLRKVRKLLLSQVQLTTAIPHSTCQIQHFHSPTYLLTEQKFTLTTMHHNRQEFAGFSS